ncbi:siderophore ABC transporter substrate-binding protein [Paenibacillus macerans]|uniref:siderophore ABC transporter substrate-binding protein n=1 Tax=Paenibacillus macerans TaxID=44252 RepID=UPI002041037A|nr:siderophore ABC transporter substrate-binding protein [Paenibacillus macerans]MCM3700879.1 siderophore ABC transporter substrate-binding protein [Paenibacillus macerans]
MNRKISMLLMTVFLVVLLAACGSNQGGSAAGNGGNGAAGKAGETSTNTAEPAAAASAEMEELTIKHQLGEAKVKKNPGNVVVFDYGVLETLDKLGVEVAAVPQGNLPAHLKKYEDAKYTNAGTLFEPDFEKLNALEPGVIFISGRSSEAYEELNKIAPTIFMGVDTKNYLDSFTENVKTLGQIFGKEAEAEQELAAISDSIQAVKETAAASGQKGLVILTTGGKVSAYGPGSRFGLIHDVFGVPAVDDTIEASTHGQSISFEYVAEKNPDYLFVVDRDAVVTEEGKQAEPAAKLVENDLVKKTNAYKNGKIIYLDASYWYLSGGGLLSMPEMLKEVHEGIK